MNWCGDMINKHMGAEWDNRATATVVQFSGIKQLESQYQPDSDGWADPNKTLRHYKVESGPSVINSSYRKGIKSELDGLDTLDGNSQLFLCMQDLSNEYFLNKMSAALKTGKNDRVKFLIIVTDEEWDIANLTPSRSLNASLSEEPEDSDVGQMHRRISTQQRPTINRSARALVPALANKVYEDVFPVIVRPKSGADDLEESTLFALNRLTGGKREANFCDVRGGHMAEDMAAAMKKICDAMKKFLD